MSAFKALREKTEEDVRWYGKKYQEAVAMLEQINKLEALSETQPNGTSDE